RSEPQEPAAQARDGRGSPLGGRLRPTGLFRTRPGRPGEIDRRALASHAWQRSLSAADGCQIIEEPIQRARKIAPASLSRRGFLASDSRKPSGLSHSRGLDFRPHYSPCILSLRGGYLDSSESVHCWQDGMLRRKVPEKFEREIQLSRNGLRSAEGVK